jgi:hypothetical protein
MLSQASQDIFPQIVVPDGKIFLDTFRRRLIMYLLMWMMLLDSHLIIFRLIEFDVKLLQLNTMPIESATHCEIICEQKCNRSDMNVVCEGYGAFEDWYVFPTLIQTDILEWLRSIRCDNMNSAFIRERLLKHVA